MAQGIQSPEKLTSGVTGGDSTPTHTNVDRQQLTPAGNKDAMALLFGREQDYVLSLNLILLALLVHRTEDCILCQPGANYRPLRLGDIKQQKFQEAMLNENQDIKEEMYVFLYEIKSNESMVDGQCGVPIYPTYSVDTTTDDIHEIQGKIATFPSDEAVLKLANAMEIGKSELVKLQGLKGNKLIKAVMKCIGYIQNDMIEKTIFTTRVTTDNGQTFKKDATPDKIAHNFRKFRENIQSKTNVRLALVGGLHRTALVTHILGNYVIHGNKPKISNTGLYKIKKSSSLNTELAVHIILPTESQNLDSAFIMQAQHYSKTVNDRKKISLDIPISGQLYQLLKTNTEESLHNLRYLPRELMVDTMVCACSKIIFYVFLHKLIICVFSLFSLFRRVEKNTRMYINMIVIFYVVIIP